MIRTGTMSRSVRSWRVRGGAVGVVVVLGTLAIVAGTERAVAFQDGDGRKSVLASQSAAASQSPKPAPRDAEKEDTAKAPKLTPQEARELTQALRQLQAAVQAEHPGSGRAVAVNVHRPTRSVTPPTITSAELDRLVQQYLVKNDPKVDPAPITTDVEFVRRVYFDLIGKPPTPEQFMAFVRDRARDKRARLIDSLLNSKDWARNWARYWRDVVKFHATNENLARVRFDADGRLADRSVPCQQALGRDRREIDHGERPQRRERRRGVSRWLMKPSPSRWPARCRGSSSASRSSVPSATTTRPIRGSACSFTSSRRSSPVRRPKQVVQGGQGQLPVFAVVDRPRARYTMPDKDNPTKQIPIAPRFFLSPSGSKHAEPALPETCGPRATPEPGRLVRHRPG